MATLEDLNRFNDRELLARTLQAEAGNQDVIGKLAVPIQDRLHGRFLGFLHIDANLLDFAPDFHEILGKAFFVTWHGV